MLFVRTVQLRGVPFRFNAMANRNFSTSRIRKNVEHVKNLEKVDELSPGNTAAEARLAVELNRLTRGEMHSYVKLMFTFGVGVVVLGLGGGAYKLISYDAARDEKQEARFNTKIDQIKEEVKEDIAGFKKEVKEDIVEVKKELGDIKKDVAELKGSMNILISIMQSRK
ncbi:hypothetical protein L873DRAFT_668878 [Choiromyces venosus 120613-1]|uniref:Uncharacterized protein n=1 Tax=Choiromyces venosus 120613-1 TaxID=1336337 RepID=A0A3N4ITS3_9PEZI|nr:hypothetical protein L873DRAFT_668878 [Choiromyces venosus 120613-1]